ncbi:hypothetical protein, partial [Nostoc sp.]|uniref:hypothetical protein n=1 Tax=Nostoc sp. TaxID=1180 RepID=UPI002FF564A8
RRRGSFHPCNLIYHLSNPFFDCSVSDPVNGYLYTTLFDFDFIAVGCNSGITVIIQCNVIEPRIKNFIYFAGCVQKYLQVVIIA